mmetsp:Transcript_25677/g.28002  ORF Transcript_25677/g.28002 Transcript_25677/m.28002 type:complete len:332 (-) Transcript_25677:395-1390(-)|eukprot:gene11836-12912_t
MSLKGGEQDDDRIDIMNAFAHGKRSVTPQMIDTVMKIIPTLTCTVTDTLNWSDLTVGEQFTLEIDETHGNNYMFSTEHLVIFAYMRLPGNTPSTPSTPRSSFMFRRSSKETTSSSTSSDTSQSSTPPPTTNTPAPARRKRVIIKYHLHQNNGESITVKNMTKSHCESIINNYNTIHSYLCNKHKQNQFNNINVVSLCIAESKTRGWLWHSNFANLWIEEYIPHFTRMWHKLPKEHITIIASTDHAELMELQKSFYYDHSEKFTIADLQGGMKELTNGNNEYILCDIEFTNTLQKFSKIGDPFYTNRELITIAKRQWERKEKKSKKHRCIIS